MREGISDMGCFLPGPNCGEEVLHVYTLSTHLHHPRVFKHTPW